MADAFPSFLATCKAPGAYIGANAYVVDMSIDASPDKIILGASVPRYSDAMLQIDTKGRDPQSGDAYTKDQLANYAFVIKACSYSITDPDAKRTARDLAVAVAAMSDAAPAPAPKSKKSLVPTTAAELRAAIGTNSRPTMSHDLHGVLR